MGQGPSCVQPFMVPEKAPKLVSYAPDSQSMTSPRSIPVSRPSSMSSLTSTASSRSKPALKSLDIEDGTTESRPISHSSLVSWLKKKRTPAFVIETPKGELKATYPHHCPICYRHFKSIYSTSCCSQNCCHECALTYIAMRQPDLKFRANAELNVACPNCNQNHGIAFIALAQQDASRVYVESPRTLQLLEESQTRRLQAQQPQLVVA